MGAHQYGGCDRGGMALSLDSMYYHHHHQQLQLQDYPHYSAFKEAPPPMTDDDGITTASKGYAAVEHGGGEGGPVGYNELQSLSLSMSPGSQSSYVTGSQQIPAAAAAVGDCMGSENKKRGAAEKGDQKQIVHRKSIDTFGQRTSQYRGVTRFN